MSVDASAVARVLGISMEFVDLRGDNAAFLPQRIAVVAQGSSSVVYSETKRRIRSATEAGQIYGFGSPIHLIARELFPTNGDGVGTVPVTVYPLNDTYDGAGLMAVGRINIGGSQTKTATYRVRIGGVLSQWFTWTAGMSVAARASAMETAINAVLEMPVVADDHDDHVSLVMKWAGETGNDCVVEVPTANNSATFGVLQGGTFTAVQPSGGAGNPTVTNALDQVGNVWETMFLNGLNVADETALDAFQEFGEGRWGELVRRPCVVFVGNTEADPNTAVAITSTRKDDRVNSQLVAPGSPNLPFVVAARQLARIARQANNNPPTDYGAKRIDRIIAGTDAEQWDYPTRDSVVKDGSSTVEVADGVVTIGDVVTMYHPTGEEPPAYRYVVDIVRAQNAIFNYDLVFGAEEWAAAPLIPSDQATTNPNARKPSSVLAASAAILDGLGDAAIISDPETAKKNQTCVIDPGNPKRFNLVVPMQFSGNTNVKSIDLKWGFFFGG